MTADFSKIIDGFSIENILQISSLEKKDLTMRVSALDRIGYIYISGGELIDARTGEYEGYDAALDILCWEGIQVKLLEPEIRERTVKTPLMKILLSASKLKDEREKNIGDNSSKILEKAIELAEAHKYRAAHSNLVTYLKKNKKNVGGWIWYSRINGKLEAMEKALQVAHKLSPDDPLVREEKNTFSVAKEKLSGGDIRKCLFCWAPLDKKAHSCHNCGGVLTINKEALNGSKRPDPAPFITAVRRYSQACEKYPDSPASRYCLCLANINLGRLNDALHHLDMLVKQLPDKEEIVAQLNLLMTFLASRNPKENRGEGPTTTDTEGSDRVATIETSVVKNRKKILVVEDSPTIRKVISIALKRNGYTIAEAADGLEALSCLSQGKPDLILLDVILPKMDGFKILSIIKGNIELRAIPIIMLTSKDGFIDRVKGRMAGAIAYITKPFDPDMMIREINKHI